MTREEAGEFLADIIRDVMTERRKTLNYDSFPLIPEQEEALKGLELPIPVDREEAFYTVDWEAHELVRIRPDLAY